MDEQIADLIEETLGARPARLATLGGGCVSQVLRAEMPDGSRVVAKIDRAHPGALDAEAFSLRFLAERSALPVPAVLARSGGVLVMEHIEGSPGARGPAEEHAAGLLADLHTITAPRFGFERETAIGGLPQPNPWSDSWLAFFRDRRLCFMARCAHDAGRLPAPTLARVERLAARLEEWITEPAAPSLIHGDVWSGNVLSRDGAVSGFLDPAIYFAHAEIELAFITLFSTFGERFFAAYRERRPIRDGFLETRRNLYNLYPLLVHTRLFGGHYTQSVETTLRRFGC